MNKLDRNLSENIRIMALVVTEICQRSTLQSSSNANLTRNQFTILKALSSEQDFQISDLARVLDISIPAVSKNIDRLEKLEMVARRTNLEDRRSLELVLLEDGLSVIRQFDEVLGKKQEHLVNQFSDQEKGVLLDLLKRVITFTLSEEQNTELICLQCGGNCGEYCVVESTLGGCSLESKRPDVEQ